MTGYTVHTGSSVKYSTGWDTIFGVTGTPGKTKAAAKKKAAKKKPPSRTKKSR